MENAFVHKSHFRLHKLLGISGMISAPLFFTVAITQAATRTGVCYSNQSILDEQMEMVFLLDQERRHRTWIG